MTMFGSLQRSAKNAVLVLFGLLLLAGPVRCEDQGFQFYNCLETLVIKFPDHRLREFALGTVADEGKNINPARAFRLFRESQPTIPSSFAWGLDLRPVSDSLIDSIVALAFEYRYPDCDVLWLADSCTALGRYSVAERIADLIPGAYFKSSAYQYMATHEIENGDTADAVRLLSKIMNVPLNPNVQSNICVWTDAALLYADAGDTLSAHKVLNRAKMVAPSDIEGGHVALSYGDIGEAYFKIGLADSVYRIIALLDALPFGTSEINKITNAAIESDNEKLARYGMEHLKDTERIFNAWVSLSKAKRERELCDSARYYLDEATRLLPSLFDDSDKCWDLCRLAEELLQCGFDSEAQLLLAESERIARTIPIREHDGLEINESVLILGRIAEVQLGFGEIAEGVRLLNETGDEWETWRVVGGSYRYLCNSGDSLRAEQILTVISEPETRLAIRTIEGFPWTNTGKNRDQIAMLSHTRRSSNEAIQDSLAYREWLVGLYQDPNNRLHGLLELADDFLVAGNKSKATTLAREATSAFLDISFIDMEDTISFRLVDLFAALGDSTQFLTSVIKQSLGESSFNITSARLARRYIESGWYYPILESIREVQDQKCRTLLAALTMAWLFLLEPSTPTIPPDFCRSLIMAIG